MEDNSTNSSDLKKNDAFDKLDDKQKIHYIAEMLRRTNDEFEKEKIDDDKLQEKKQKNVK